jgi:GNAT superfamily N-acetyltransferase
MLTAGPQRAWLAIAEGQVVGFCIGFATCGLRGPSWEIDLLAVKQEWTKLGLATRLIRVATAHGARVARHARAVVATDNPASARAFTRAGFRRAGTCDLLLCRPEEPAPRAQSVPGLAIRKAGSITQAVAWLPNSLLPESHRPVSRSGNCPELDEPALLLAEQHGQPAGYAELVEVQTLLYWGVWIESLAASTHQVQAALIRDILRGAVEAGLDEIGSMVPQDNQALRDTLLHAGFRSQGEFNWLKARLPLPGLASRSGDSYV